jgi:hypothetical protein
LRNEKLELEDDTFWALRFPKSLSGETKKGWNFYRCLQLLLGKTPITSMNGGVLEMVPADILSGDDIAIFEGARMPYILRKVEDTDSFQLVGAYYIHGVMEGGVIGSQWYEEARYVLRLV